MDLTPKPMLVEAAVVDVRNHVIMHNVAQAVTTLNCRTAPLSEQTSDTTHRMRVELHSFGLAMSSIRCTLSM